jgi:AAA+ superfamily predicted ATPase
MLNDNLKNEYFETIWELFNLLTQRSKQLRADIDGDFGLCRISGKKENTSDENTITALNQQIQQVETNLMTICQKAKEYGIEIPLEKLAETYNLTCEEKYILAGLFLSSISAVTIEDKLTGADLLLLLGYKPKQFINKAYLLKSLIKKGLIDTPSPGWRRRNSVFEISFSLTNVALKGIAGDEVLIESLKEPEEFDDAMENLIVVRDPVMTFDQIIFDNATKQAIERALFQIENAKRFLTEWGFNETVKYGKGVTMLFYGPPGTGKTATCEAIANRLGKKIGIVSYAQVLGKWVGESEKALVRIFQQAKDKDLVLVFDEAEALFGKRLIETYSTDRMHNYMTNILMQELERFEGVVILTTNREIVLDEAFARRILLKLKFEIPNACIRAKIWRSFFTEKAPLAEDVDFEELGKRFELSGGEIKNAVLKAVNECAFSGERITMAILTRFAKEELVIAVKKKVGFIA